MLFVPLLSFFVSHAVNYHCDSTRKRLVAIGQWLWDRAMKFGHPDNYPCSCYSPEHIPPKQSPESVQFIFTWCRPLPPPPSANIKRSTVNLYKIDRSRPRSVRVRPGQCHFQLFALITGVSEVGGGNCPSGRICPEGCPTKCAGCHSSGVQGENCCACMATLLLSLCVAMWLCGCK